MKSMIQGILRGHLRSIVGSLDVEQLLRERSTFNEAVLKECSQELARMGIKILTLVVQDVRDNEGYIDALGKQAVAEAKRDANIATAEAERETKVKTSAATRLASEAEADNDAKTKLAQKNRDIQVAEFRKATAAATAEADMAGEIAKTAQQQRLNILQAERDQKSAEAQAKVQEEEAKRKKQELQATVIVEAEAQAQAASIKATGQQNAERILAETRKNVAELDAETQKLTAEGAKNATVLSGEGEAQKLQTVAGAQAEATRKTKIATADGDKAIALAGAEGQKAVLLATAEGIRASKTAEAEGTLRMAEALQKLSEQGQLMLILDRLPLLFEKGGDAGAKIADAIFGNLGKSVEKIDSITITDLGGNGGAERGISAVSGMIPKMVTDFFVQAKARGIDVSGLLSFLKMDPAKLMTMLGPIAAPAAKLEEPVVATPRPVGGNGPASA